MRFTTTTLGAAGAALLTTAALAGCGTPATATTEPLDQRAEYHDTLRLWLKADADEKAEVCQAVMGVPAGTLQAGQSTGGVVPSDAFSEEFLTGRC
jgi:hypothetical protein